MRRRHSWAAVAGTVTAGSLAAVQVRLNGGLGAGLDDGFAAATLSFTSGLAVLAVMIGFSRTQRRSLGALRDSLASGAVPVWMLIACLGAAVAVLGQTVAAGVIGVTLFSIGIVAGRSVSAMVIDSVGLGPGGKRKITLGRIVGTAITLLAVAAVPLLGGGVVFAGETPPVWAMVFALLAGGGLAFQQAANGGLRVRSGSGVVSTAVVFAVGAVVLGVCFAIRLPSVGVPHSWPSNPLLYGGGVVGVAFVALSAILVVRVGVLMLGLGGIVGQLGAAVVLDALWPTGGSSASLLVGVATVLLAIVGATIASEPWRSSSVRPSVTVEGARSGR